MHLSPARPATVPSPGGATESSRGKRGTSAAPGSRIPQNHVSPGGATESSRGQARNERRPRSRIPANPREPRKGRHISRSQSVTSNSIADMYKMSRAPTFHFSLRTFPFFPPRLDKETLTQITLQIVDKPAPNQTRAPSQSPPFEGDSVSTPRGIVSSVVPAVESLLAAGESVVAPAVQSMTIEVASLARKKAKSKAKSSDSGATIGYEAELGQMADALPNNMDAAEYKHVVLGLIFLKYISDAYGGLNESRMASRRDEIVAARKVVTICDHLSRVRGFETQGTWR